MRTQTVGIMPAGDTGASAASRSRGRSGFKPVFSGKELADITTPAIREYIADGQAAKASPAEINQELGALSKMFELAIQDGGCFPPSVC